MVRLPIVLLFLLPISAAQAQIAFVKHHRLYVLACDSSGVPSRGAKAVFVCPLKRRFRDDPFNIQWTPDHRIVIAQGDDPSSYISIVGAQRGAKPARLTKGFWPSFSPDGNLMLYDTDQLGGATYLFNLKTRSAKKLSPNADQSVWSKDGKRIAFVKGISEDGPVEIRSFPDWRFIRTVPIGNPVDLRFSPDGKRFSVEGHLSRPLTGDSIFDIETGQGVSFDSPEKFAPALIEDWSPDSKRVLCDYRIQDPQNDGTWDSQKLGVAPVGGGKCRLLSYGSNGRFSADGRWVLYLRDREKGIGRKGGDLTREAASGGHRTVLIRAVQQFAVYRW